MVEATSSPPATLNIKIGDRPVTVSMPFARLGELATLVGGVERVPELSFNPTLGMEAIDICLAARDADHRRLPNSVPGIFEMSIADGVALINWIADHVLDFFLMQMEKHMLAIQASGPRLTAVGSSLNGSAASPSKTP